MLEAAAATTRTTAELARLWRPKARRACATRRKSAGSEQKLHDSRRSRLECRELRRLIPRLQADIDTMRNADRPTIADPALQMRLAKYLVQQCFRNSVLEDLHAGIAPSSKSGDYSDVVVRTPFGEIPWRRLSRL